MLPFIIFIFFCLLFCSLSWFIVICQWNAAAAEKRKKREKKRFCTQQNKTTNRHLALFGISWAHSRCWNLELGTGTMMDKSTLYTIHISTYYYRIQCLNDPMPYTYIAIVNILMLTDSLVGRKYEFFPLLFFVCAIFDSPQTLSSEYRLLFGCFDLQVTNINTEVWFDVRIYSISCTRNKHVLDAPSHLFARAAKSILDFFGKWTNGTWRNVNVIHHECAKCVTCQWQLNHCLIW